MTLVASLPTALSFHLVRVLHLLDESYLSGSCLPACMDCRFAPSAFGVSGLIYMILINRVQHSSTNA
jgi:hypothetical protein